MDFQICIYLMIKSLHYKQPKMQEQYYSLTAGSESSLHIIYCLRTWKEPYAANIMSWH